MNTCVCGDPTTRDDLCTACEDASKDSESPWDLGPGDWVLRGHRRVWVSAAEVAQAPRGRCPVCTKTFTPRGRQTYCGKKCKDAAWWRRSTARRRAAERAAMNPNLVALMDAVDSTEKEAAA